MRRVVVTGLGMVAATGNNVNAAWKTALEARSCIRRIRAFDPSEFPVQIAAEVDGFELGDILEPKEAKRATRFVQFGVAAAHEAMMDSGYDFKHTDNVTFGCSVGAGLGSLEDIEKNTLILKEKGVNRISPFFIPYTIANMPAGVISRIFNLKGPNLCTATACASGTHAIGEAYLHIMTGMAEAMIAGGTESTVSPLGIGCFAAMKALSTNNDHPEEASRPFDLDRDGFIIGEGAGLIVLEELESAKKRGAKIYAELVGYGASGDAYHITAPAPEGEGARRCIKTALTQGRIPLDTIDYINAHGTSTKLNDALETKAISDVFGHLAPSISISSTKSITGHCLGAAGGVEAVYTVMAIHKSIVPPTANYRKKDPECHLDYTPNTPRERKIRVAMSNSFGFGGTNGTIVFKRFEG